MKCGGAIALTIVGTPAAIFGLRMAIKNFDLWGPMFTSAVGSNQSWNGSHPSAHHGHTTGSTTGSSPE